MQVDLSIYSPSLKASIQTIFLKRDENGRKRILEVSDPFSVPCIVILFWCGEVSGWPDYLERNYQIQIEFYGYTIVHNKPDGCPWGEI